MLDFKLEFNFWTLKAGRAVHDAKNYLKQSQMFRASGYSARNSTQTTLTIYKELTRRKLFVPGK